MHRGRSPLVLPSFPPGVNRAALLDWDGTLREGFTIFAWADRLAEEGLLTPGAVGELRELREAYEAGALPHNELAARTARVLAAALRGGSTEPVERTARSFVDADLRLLFPWTRTLLQELGRRHVAAIVISGAPIEVLRAYAERLELSAVYGLRFEVRAGRYSGELLDNPGVEDEKLKVVEAVRAHFGDRIVLAVGNSESDRPLFRASPLSGVVNNPGLVRGSGMFELSAATSIPDLLARADRPDGGR